MFMSNGREKQAICQQKSSTTTIFADANIQLIIELFAMCGDFI
jgi:hypothetical protein